MLCTSHHILIVMAQLTRDSRVTQKTRSTLIGSGIAFNNGGNKTNASARRMSTNGGAVKSMCNTLTPFSRPTFPSLIVASVWPAVDY